MPRLWDELIGINGLYHIKKENFLMMLYYLPTRHAIANKGLMSEAFGSSFFYKKW